MLFVNISVGTKDSFLLNKAAAEVAVGHPGLRYANYDSADLDSDPELLLKAVSDVKMADFVALKVHGDTSYMKKFDRIAGALEEGGASALLDCTDDEVTVRFRPLFKGDDAGYVLARSYYVLGGDANFTSLFLWALREFGGEDVEVPEPEMPPAQGIYYPGREGVGFDFLDSLDPSKPNIGVFFHQKQWVTGNLDSVDGLIRAIERRGGNPVPVFLHNYEDPATGAVGLRRVLDEQLTRRGRPLLDVIVETMSFSMTLVANPGCGEQVSDDNFFERYGAPVIHVMMPSASREEWEADMAGLSASEIAFDVAHPEFDGQIISVASSSTERLDDGSRMYMSIEDRADRVADTAVMWARLRHIPNSERKVAVLLYMYPPKTANAGGAAGLDTLESVVGLLHRMEDDGYDVGPRIPETARELIDTLLEGLTNDTEWISDAEVSRRTLDVVPLEDYGRWYSELSDRARAKIEEGWDEPPGDFYTTDGGLMVPGTLFGNVLVGFQPDRGRNIQKSYHDPTTVMPHQYLAYYRWLRRVFGADAVVHVGTHGTLEWLPGKSVAMSADCCPDYVLDSLPDVYPYTIGNPGEGTQAKRRGAAVIVDHMIPTMTRAGGYDELEELEQSIQKYMSAGTQRQSESGAMILAKVRESVAEMEMYNDLKLDPACSDEEFAARMDDLYDYVTEVKGNLIKDGLHVLGRVPEGPLMDETVYSLTRLDNGEVPSMRAAIAEHMGFDVYDLKHNPSEEAPDGRLKGQVLDDVEDRDFAFIGAMRERGFNLGACLELAEELYPGCGELREAVEFVCTSLHPNLEAMGGEIDSVMRALEGRFVRPGPAGCPTRGRAQILPTGRNFYSLDPESVPWHSSWEIGRRMADQMLERHIREHGAYPRTVGIVIWATDTMRAGGDDVAYILWLMGLRPVWNGYAGRVTDIEVIPLEDLGRPRIDVTLRISGLFRDTFPNLVTLIDRGVGMISGLDETDEENYLAANLREDVARMIAEGVPRDRAMEEAAVRIFGDPPGTYGSGTNIAIRTGAWQDVSDIGDLYCSYGQHAYGVRWKGEAVPELFRRRLELMEVTVKNSASREYDMLDNDDVYNDLGGLNAAVRSARGEMPMSVIGCSADTEDVVTRTVDEEGRFIFRSKINNPKWLEGLKRHGFRGAKEILDMTEYVFAWDATSDIVDPWMYQSIADRFLFDPETAEWFEDANPHAMQDTAEWLLQAISRGMWDADDATRERLERLYLDLESRFEGMQ